MKLPNETILLVLKSWESEASQGGNIDTIYTDIINCIKSQESKLTLAMQIIEKLEKSNAFYADAMNWDSDDEYWNCETTKDFSKSPEKLDKFVKDKGFNPTVTTKGSLNNVSLELSVKINKDNLNYLANLAHQTIKEVEELKKGLK